ncbi:DUF2742 domain-containing protein [Mycobacterium tuberculosis]|nr:DUF2742 domain-containing protein [Mycobacterium tuberculosis]
MTRLPAPTGWPGYWTTICRWDAPSRPTGRWAAICDAARHWALRVETCQAASAYSTA